MPPLPTPLRAEDLRLAEDSGRVARREGEEGERALLGLKGLGDGLQHQCHLRRTSLHQGFVLPLNTSSDDGPRPNRQGSHKN
jgi:hypothetical protein